MPYFFKKTLLFLLALGFGAAFVSCSDNNPDAKKPPLYWYKSLVEALDNGNVEKAGDHYASLKAEQANSVFLPQACLMMAMAHMENEEYLLANFYLDEYLKKYGDKASAGFIKYLKILSAYRSFKQPKRNQMLLLETINNVDLYTQENPSGEFYHHAATLSLVLKIADATMNKNIAKLYGKRDKPQAQKIYEQKAHLQGEENLIIEQPHVSWLRWLFE